MTDPVSTPAPVSPVQELKASLAVHGIEIAEDAVKKLIEVTFDFATKQIIASENKYDDMLLAFLPRVKDELLKLADKIDGQVG